MSWFLKLFGIDFQKIIDKRRNQLEEQARIDAELRKLDCSSVVSEFLLLERERNRRNLREFDNADFRNKYTVLYEQLEQVDKEQERVHKALLELFPCAHLLTRCEQKF